MRITIEIPDTASTGAPVSPSIVTDQATATSYAAESNSGGAGPDIGGVVAVQVDEGGSAGSAEPYLSGLAGSENTEAGRNGGPAPTVNP
jgi:hypothetical protein